jgi:hypothetical protein
VGACLLPALCMFVFAAIEGLGELQLRATHSQFLSRRKCLSSCAHGVACSWIALWGLAGCALCPLLLLSSRCGNLPTPTTYLCALSTAGSTFLPGHGMHCTYSPQQPWPWPRSTHSERNSFVMLICKTQLLARLAWWGLLVAASFSLGCACH